MKLKSNYLYYSPELDELIIVYAIMNNTVYFDCYIFDGIVDFINDKDIETILFEVGKF